MKAGLKVLKVRCYKEGGEGLRTEMVSTKACKWARLGGYGKWGKGVKRFSARLEKKGRLGQGLGHVRGGEGGLKFGLGHVKGPERRIGSCQGLR